VVRALASDVKAGYLQAFTHSLQPIFVIAVPIALSGFALTWFLKEQRLRDKTDGLQME
jgi:hypothetical protein